MIPRHVVVFAREPRFGAVKTRLAADMGRGAALAFYRRVLGRLVRRLVSDGRWTTWLAITPAAASRRPRRWHGGARAIAQTEGDLGQRMAAAFQRMPPGPVVIVGSDIPDLGPAQVADAFRLLRHNEVVLGPTRDGGYYLIGLAPDSRLLAPFGGVRWSTPHALADTVANLPPDCRVAFTKRLIDIDTGDDLRDWRGR